MKLFDRIILHPYYRRALKKCGKNVTFGDGINITWKNCSIDDDVSIGGGSTIYMCTGSNYDRCTYNVWT